MDLVYVEGVRLPRAILNRPILDITLVNDDIRGQRHGIERLWHVSLFGDKENRRRIWMLRVHHLLRKVELPLAHRRNGRESRLGAWPRRERVFVQSGRLDRRGGSNDSG